MRAKLAQRWKLSPPAIVARAQVLTSTPCVLSLFVFFVIALRSFLAGVPIFPLLKTTLAHSNSIWNAQALSNNNKILIYGKSRPPSPKIKHGGGGGGSGGGERVAVSFYPVQDWSSWVPKFFLGEQITFVVSPFYIASFGVGTIYSTKENITAPLYNKFTLINSYFG